VLVILLSLPVLSQASPKLVVPSNRVIRTEELPRAETDSPVIQVKQATRGSARPQGTTDLWAFFEMDDTQAAARSLREHLRSCGISLSDGEPVETHRGESGEPDKLRSRPARELVHVFSGFEFTPEPGIEAELAERLRDLESEGRHVEAVCILQLQQHWNYADIVRLLELGVRVYEPVGAAGAIVRLPSSSIREVTNLESVRWIGAYRSEYKYELPLSTSTRPTAFIYPIDGDRPGHRADLAAMGIHVRGYDAVIGSYFVLLDVSRFGELAEAMWWVKGIAKDPEDETHSLNFEPDDSREMIASFEAPYNGTGVDVGVRDTGIWSGNTLDFPAGSFVSLGGWEDDYGHGTHVCGILAGRGVRDLGCAHDGEGVASGATLYVASGVGGTGGGYSYQEAFAFFSDNNARLSNHSWGYYMSYSYNSHTENIDGYADNGDAVIVFGAGNEYDAYKVSNPATAKNVITVGGIRYLTDDYMSSREIGGRAEYSSQGPTADDQRLKPELVAPGGQNWTDYAYTKNGVVSTDNSSTDDDDNVWDTNYWYTRDSGTSVATPHVTGVCAKVLEWSPGLHSEPLKALLVNTSIPIKDNSENSTGAYANTQVGYGMANAFSVTNHYEGESSRLLFAEGSIDEDDSQLWSDWEITVPSDTDKLIVTMAYNDEEGEYSNGCALIDDIDLSLISPGGTEHFASDYLPPNINTESPLEKLVMLNPMSGTWTVRVSFTSSPGFDNPFIFAEQRYGVVAHAVLRTPALSLDVAQSTVSVGPGESFIIDPTITNTGGYIAAGITVRANGPSSFGGDNDVTRYVGNLMYEGASLSPQITLEAPSSPGQYTVTVEADGINKEFDTGEYPKTRNVTVNVVPFTDIGAGLAGADHTSVAWGDYDNDGDLDILITGEADSGCISSVYENDAGSFADIGAGLPGVGCGSAAWGDYDNDGDLDILITGDTGVGYIASVYENDAGSFTDIGAGLTGVYLSSAVWGDYDNDGDLDILITGHSGSVPISRVYENDGGGFTDIAAGLPAAACSSVAWGDYDNDGDLDVLLTGDTLGQIISRVYENNAGSFTDISAALPGVRRGSAAWGDYDNDGDLDILMTGEADTGYLSSVYENNAGSFTDIAAGLSGTCYGSAAWGDYDNDGDLDILLTGHTGSQRISCLYRNDVGSFTETGAGIPGISNGSAAWGDYDNDGDLDILLTGDTGSEFISRVYQGEGAPANTPPAPPSNLSFSLDGNVGTFSWDVAGDAETPSAGLTYNLRVGTTPGGAQLCSAMADSASGYRRVARLGNTNHNTTWEITLSDTLPPWAYWTVQAVDSAFEGSAFAPVDTVLLGATGISHPEEVIPTAFRLHPGSPNPFNPRTMIRYDLPTQAPVRIAIYDAAGRHVVTLVDAPAHPPGRHQVVWDGRNAVGRGVASGIYFCRMESGDFREVRKMALVR
jgi:predicted nucleotidyltransferase